MIFTTDDGVKFETYDEAKAHDKKLLAREQLAKNIERFLKARSPDVEVSKRALSGAVNIISDWTEYNTPSLASVPVDGEWAKN